MTERKPAIATRVSPYIDKAVRKLAKGLGITISEYLRGLILQDLDYRNLFRDELKRTVETEEISVKQVSPANSLRKILYDLRKEDAKQFASD